MSTDVRPELSSDGPGMLLLATENPLHVSPGKNWSVLKNRAYLAVTLTRVSCIRPDRSPRALGSPRTLQLRGRAPFPHCQLKRPSVRLTRDGGGPGRLWLKWWTVKLRGIRMTGERAQKQTSRSTCFLMSLLMCLFMLGASDWGKTLQSYVWDTISGLSVESLQ